MSLVDRVLVRGDAKTSVVTRRGTQIDLRVVARAPARRGAALLHRLEGAQHQAPPARARARLDAQRVRALRDRGRQGRRQRDRGADLRGARSARSSRRSCARTRARSRRPRRARCRGRSATCIGDFHVHTTVSGDGRSSLEEVVAAAKARGYRVLAITDHAEGTLSGVGREALLEQRAQHPRAAGGARRLAQAPARRRAEHRARPGSSTTTSSSAAASTGASRRCTTTSSSIAPRRPGAIVTAMHDPTVRMIGHLSARMIGGRPPIDLDLDAIFDAAEETGTALEVNGGAAAARHVGRGAAPRARARRHVRAHERRAPGRRARSRALAALNAERAWIDPERVANAWSAEKLIAWTS